MSRNSHRSPGNTRLQLGLRTALVLVLVFAFMSPYTLFPMSANASARAKLRATEKQAEQVAREGSVSSGAENATALNGAQVTATAAALPQAQASPTPNYGGIIFPHGNAQFRSFHKVNPDGTNRIRLTNATVNFGSPSVSSQTGMIAFTLNGYHNTAVFVMNGDGSGIRKLTDIDISDFNDSRNDFNPRISPDGTKVAFISDRHRNDAPYYTCHNGNPLYEQNEVYVINVDGTNMQQATIPEITDTTAPNDPFNGFCGISTNYQVAWSADSQHLVIFGTRPYQRYSGDTRPGFINSIVAWSDSGRFATLYGDNPDSDPFNRDLPASDPNKRAVGLISNQSVKFLDVNGLNRILFTANLGGTGFGGFSDENVNSIGLWTPGDLNVGYTSVQSLMGQLGYGGTTDGQPHGGGISDARFSPDGNHFLIYGHSPLGGNNINTLFIDGGGNPIPNLANGDIANNGMAWAPGPAMPQPARLVLTPNPVLSYAIQQTLVTPSLFDAQGNVIAHAAQLIQDDNECPTCGFRCDFEPDEMPCTGFGGRDATIDFTGTVTGSGNEGSDNLCAENAGLRACVPHYNTAGYAFISVSPTAPTTNSSGTGAPGVFTIRREGNPSNQGSLQVAFSVSGTAVRDLDYSFDVPGETIALTAGQMSLDVHVHSLRSQPLDKTVVLTLQPDFGSTYSLYSPSSTATVTLTSDNTVRNCVTAPSGMAGWWSGDGNTNDVLGNNNGVAEGSLGFSPGFVSQAFDFDGTTADVKVPASGTLNVGAGSGMTIDAWIKPSDLAMRPIVEWDSSGNYGVHFWMSVNGYGPAGALFANLQDTSGNGHVVYTTGAALNANTYQHVALTYDKTNGKVAMYVNGSPVATSTTNLGIFTPQTSYDLYLGARVFPDSWHYSGQMDEVELFNRTLNASEVFAIYAGGAAGKCKPGATPAPTPLTLSSITPDRGGDQGIVSATVYGSAIQPGATLKLSRAGQADVVGQSVNVTPGGSSIQGLFNLIGRQRGTWNVVVTNPDGTTATPVNGFTVEPAVAPHLWAEISGRETIRASHTATMYTVAYGNSGNNDAYGVPFFILGIPRNAEVSVLSPLMEIPGQTDGSISPVVQTDFEQVIPLILPVVRAGSTNYFRFSMRANSFADGTFELTALMTAPLIKAATTAPSSVKINEGDLDQLRSGSQTLSATNTRKTHHARARVTRNFANANQDIIDIGDTIAFYRSNEGLECLYALFNAGLACGSAIIPFLKAAKEASQVAACLSGFINFFGGLTATVVSAAETHSTPNAAAATQLGTSAVGTIPSCAGEAASYLPVLGNVLNAIGCIAALKDFYDTCFTAYTKFKGRTVGSVDPNEKEGPNGTTNEHYISSSQPVPYSIFFENQETATAPAQTVVVTDQLDTTKLDLSTFSLGLIGFGDKVVTPGPGLQTYDTDVDLRPGKNLIARIHAALNTTTGVASWRFQSIDPATNQPTTDPTAGFLPPDIDGIVGEGSVLFSVMPKSGLSAGTLISNQATITFDLNAPMNTNTFTNTIDNSKPTSGTSSATQASCSNDVNVRWSGTDSGSGVANYTVFLSDNGGPFNQWLTNTTSTNATYTGTAGHTYGFYSVARDNAGNTEDPPLTADTIVTVNANTPPTLAYANKSLNLGASLNIIPSSGPSDNGSVASIALLNQGTYTGGISVNNATGVISLTNAAPAGTHTIMIRATDNCGLPTNATLRITVNAPPTISCLLPITVDATSASGAIVTFTTPVATSLTANPVSVSCAPPSSSTFSIGTTNVTCTARDAINLTSSCSFNVTVSAPRQVKQQVLSAITALRATVTDKKARDKLDDAIKHLTNAIDPKLWINDSHPTEKDGEKVFDEEKGVVKDLADLIKNKKSMNPTDAALMDLIARLVQVDRVLALISISEQFDPKKISKALDEIRKGDADRDDDKPSHADNAIDYYKNAWKKS